MIRTAVVHLRSQWMGALALFLVLTGGIAYAADTIGSSDVIDESLLSQDIKNGEVKSSEIGNNQVFSADVRDDTFTDGGLDAADLNPDSVGTSEVDGSLTGGNIVDNALTGVDINEATLTTVPNASTLDGFDSPRFKNTSATGTGQCLNLGTTATTCASATISGLTAGDDVYLSVWWRWSGEGVGPDAATCAINRGAVELEGTRYGQGGNEHALNNTSAHASLVALDTVAPAGTASYLFVCDEFDGAMNILNSRIVAFRLSG